MGGDCGEPLSHEVLTRSGGGDEEDAKRRTPMSASPSPHGPAHQLRLPMTTKVEREFHAWAGSEDGRRVIHEVCRRALALRTGARVRHYGIAALFESIRYDSAVGLLGDGVYRLNNNHRSHLARLVMRIEPELVGFFEVRELRGRIV